MIILGRQKERFRKETAPFVYNVSFHPLILGINALLFSLLGGVFPDALKTCRNLAGDFFAAGFAVSPVTNHFPAGSAGILDIDVAFLQPTGLEHGNDQ